MCVELIEEKYIVGGIDTPRGNDETLLSQFQLRYLKLEEAFLPMGEMRILEKFFLDPIQLRITLPAP